MMRLICSESFLSISAMMLWMVLTASSETRAVAERACSARVLTAVATALLASAVLGLNSLLMSDSNSESSTVAAPAWAWALWLGSGITVDPFESLLGGVGGLGRGGHGLQQGGVAQEFIDEFFGASLAIHVRQQVSQLAAGGEQFVERIHFTRHGGGRK